MGRDFPPHRGREGFDIDVVIAVVVVVVMVVIEGVTVVVVVIVAVVIVSMVSITASPCTACSHRPQPVHQRLCPWHEQVRHHPSPILRQIQLTGVDVQHC